MLHLPVYLDNHATTPVDPLVINAMLPYFNDKFGNPESKNYSYGIEAEIAVENSKNMISEFTGYGQDEIFFTSGATESINLAHFGIAERYFKKGNHIITSAIEHSAVNNSLLYLQSKGFIITYLPVDSEGLINLNQLEESITEKTILISIMSANNEIGTVNNIKEIGNISKRHNILFHSDASQALGKININFFEAGIDLLSFSGHKLYAPKGIGLLLKRKEVAINPLLYGGGQQKGLRPGTLNVPYIVAVGKAIELCSSNKSENENLKKLRDYFLDSILNKIEDVKVNGTLENRLPNNINISIKHVKASTLINEVRNKLAFSSGSACSSSDNKPSRVLKAIGLSDEDANSSIRIGLGRFNTIEEIDYSIKVMTETIGALRKNSASYQLSKNY